MTATEQLLQDEVTSLQQRLLVATEQSDAKDAHLADFAAQLDTANATIASLQAQLAATPPPAPAKTAFEYHQEVARILYRNGNIDPTPDVVADLKKWALDETNE
jgi:hypothetical protein